MSWEAPNLLDKIFKEPEVPDSNALGNFFGGFVAGRQSSDDKKANSQTTSVSNGPPQESDGQPAAKWNVADWMKSTLQGKQIANNITAYTEAQASTARLRALTAGDLLHNQIISKDLQDDTEDTFSASEWMKSHPDPATRWDAPAPLFKGTKARLAFSAMQESSAHTELALATKERNAKLVGDAADLIRNGFDIPIDEKTGLPDPKVVAQAGQAFAERTQANRMAVENARTDRVIQGLKIKGQNTIDAIDEKADVGAGGTDNQPMTKELPNGTTLAWMPNGKTIHVIQNGKKREITPSQLMTIGKGLMEIGDPDYKAVIEAAKQGALPQSSGTNAPAPSSSKDPLGLFK